MHNAQKLNQPNECIILSFKVLKNREETTQFNRSKVKKGDFFFLREYGSGFWGICDIADDWANDPEAQDKHNVAACWFPINVDVKGWNVTSPHEVIRLR